jgi:hypothetical protein
MFKIMIDEKEHSRYTDTCGCVNVGSAAGAQVRLPWAAAQSLKIYPMLGADLGDFRVTVHDPEGATHHTTEWWGRRKAVTVRHDPDPRWIRVSGGESLTVRGHVIRLITWCGRCGKSHQECTCGNPRP